MLLSGHIYNNVDKVSEVWVQTARVWTGKALSEKKKKKGKRLVIVSNLILKKKRVGVFSLKLD